MNTESEPETLTHSYNEPLQSKNPLEIFVYLITIIFSTYVMWYAYTVAIPTTQYAIGVLGMALFLWGIMHARDTDISSTSGKAKLITYLSYSLVAVIPTYYFIANYFQLQSRIGIFTQTDIIMGTIMIILVLIAVAIVSRMITVVMLLGLVYAYLGPYMPGFLQHNGLTFRRIITMNTAEMSGIFGNFLIIDATWIVMFMLFAGFLEAYGGMAMFIEGISNIINKSKYMRVGQVGVLGSMAMGSINGSIAANTAVTGSFTIPMMKSRGYSGKFAGGIESVASTGGQILPPIMGAAAFVMASLIEASYAEIVIAAIAPAILFYLTVAFSIQLNAEKYGIDEGINTSSNSVTALGVLSHYEYIAAFLVLVYYLVYLQVSPTYAGLYTIVTLIVLRIVRTIHETVTESEKTFASTLISFIRQTLEGMRRGAEANVDLAIMFVALATIVRAFVVTGLAPRISTDLVILAGGSITMLLVFAMLASLVFGMAVSTTPAYLLVAILVAPALTEVGIQPLLAHFFVFMFAIAAGITPPIAVGVLVATGIAESNFWETAIEALKIGYPILVLPYAIFLHPDLINPSFMTLPVFWTMLIGLYAISIGIAGYFRTILPLHYRLFYILAGIVCIFMPMQYLGISLIVSILTVIVTIHHLIDISGINLSQIFFQEE